MAKIQDLKKENIQKIRQCFFNTEIWTKNALHEATGISLASTTNTLQYLFERNEIALVGMADSTGGRKSKQYCLNKDFKHIGLITLKRDQDDYLIDVKSVNLNDEVLYENTFQSKIGDINFLKQSIDDMFDNVKQIDILSFSVPGVVKDGYIDICDFDQLQQFDIGTYMNDTYQVPSVFDNDVNVACVGFAKDHKDVDNLVFIYQPNVEFVGCGIMINRKIYNGYSNAAGELRFLPSENDLDDNSSVDILQTRIQAVCAILNPEMVAYHSDYELPISSDNLQINYAKEHMPKLIEVKDVFKEIEKGLYQMGLDSVQELINKEDI